jgi:hypothetical protein
MKAMDAVIIGKYLVAILLRLYSSFMRKKNDTDQIPFNPSHFVTGIGRHKKRSKIIRR